MPYDPFVDDPDLLREFPPIAAARPSAVNRAHALILPYQGRLPTIPDSCWLMGAVQIVGDVTFGEQCSVFFGTVIRGDVNRITIGARTNVQDNSVLHVTYKQHALTIGSEVTIGHRVLLHGCTVEDRCLIGMGAIIMDGAVIGEGSFVGAGAVVKEGMIVPPRSLVVGLPAVVKRATSDAEYARIRQSARNYVGYCMGYDTLG